MINQEIIASLVEHKKASEIFVIKDFCKDTPSWQEFIDYIDESSRVINSGMPEEPSEYDLSLDAKIKGTVMIKQSFYLLLLMIAVKSNTNTRSIHRNSRWTNTRNIKTFL